MKIRMLMLPVFAVCVLLCRAQSAGEVLLDGEGTSLSPYQITTVQDLLMLAQATNEQGLEFDGQYFELMNDIDMASAPCFTGLGADPLHPFNGIIMGNGHKLMNWSLHECDQGGFVVWLGSKGELDGVLIDASCTFTGVSSFAPLVCHAAGIVRSCNNYAAINGESDLAGICCYTEREASIENCYNEGRIYGAGGGYLAGIVAINNGVVVRSENLGCIVAARGAMVGGVVGENTGAVSNCVSSGSLTGYGVIGGIVAVAKPKSNITFSLCDAVLKSYADYSQVGAAVGRSEYDVTYSNVYYDYQISLFNKEGSKSIWAKTTAELIYDEWDGSRAWTRAKGEYPQIYSMSHHEAAKLAAAPVVFAQGDTRFHVTQAAQLAQAEGVTWTVKGGHGVFEIDGSTLQVHPRDEFTSAILQATCGTHVKEIPIYNMGLNTVVDVVENLLAVKTSTDFNGDHVTDVADVNLLINEIMYHRGEPGEFGDMDVDVDGKIDVADVNQIINRILGL
ncbi:MAG: hypothetical protein J6I72_04955 [Muribaculaceae bacterium]|nr:hypothetical protein [Muribaculaceae bacterium]